MQSLIQTFNTSKENILRNNPNLNFYPGEIVKIKVNDYITHFVKPAETLCSISQKYNLDEQKIKQDNNLKTNNLYIGQMLKIKL